MTRTVALLVLGTLGSPLLAQGSPGLRAGGHAVQDTEPPVLAPKPPTVVETRWDTQTDLHVVELMRIGSARCILLWTTSFRIPAAHPLARWVVEVGRPTRGTITIVDQTLFPQGPVVVPMAPTSDGEMVGLALIPTGQEGNSVEIEVKDGQGLNLIKSRLNFYDV